MRKLIFVGLYMFIYTMGVGQSCNNLLGFKGGDSSFISFISNNLRYPAQARELQKTGLLFIKIKITEYGKIDTVSLLNLPNNTYFSSVILSTIYKTKGHWEHSKGNRIIILPIIFVFDDVQRNKAGDYLVQIPQNIDGILKSTQSISYRCIFVEPIILHGLGTPRYKYNIPRK